MARFTIQLVESERAALVEYATSERRDPRDQAALIVRHELERLGFLPRELELTPAPAQTQEQQREVKYAIAD